MEELQTLHDARYRERMMLADELSREARSLSCVADTFEVADAILEQLPMCIAVGDMSGWRYVSRRLSDALGCDRDQLRDVPMRELVHPDDIEDVELVSELVQRGELAWGDVTARYRVQGSETYVLLRWSWGPPRGSMKLSVAVAEILAENALILT